MGNVEATPTSFDSTKLRMPIHTEKHFPEKRNRTKEMSLSVLELRPRGLLLNNDEYPEDETTFAQLKQDLSRCIEYSFQYPSEMRRNLANIVRQFKECADLMQEFLKAYEEWEPYRKKSIEYLEDVITQLDKIHLNTNIAKITASVGGLISGCIGITGAIVTLSGGKDASSFRLASSVGNLISCGVSSGAAITELGLSKIYVDKAKLLLLNDSEGFEIMQEWFERSQHLKSAIGEVCNCDIILDVFQKLMIVGPLVTNTCGSFLLQVDEVVTQVVKLLRKKITSNDVEQIILLCAAICRNPELLKTVGNIQQMVRNAPSIMPVVTTLVKVPYELKFLAQYMSSSGNKSRNPSRNRKESTRQAITYGLFQGINVAIEIFSLSLLVEDFKKGSTSEHSAALREVKQQLEMELYLVSRVHKRLVKK